jgi:hypothetical protein
VLALNEVDGTARCQDSLAQEVQVAIKVRHGKGGWPVVGEEWFISKEFLGRWVFHAVIGPVAAPVITAPREAMDAGTEQIFDALIALGLVTEEGADFRRSEDG